MFFSGNNIKYLRVPDEVIDKVQEDPAKSEQLAIRLLTHLILLETAPSLHLHSQLVAASLMLWH